MSERDNSGNADAQDAFGGDAPSSGAEAFGQPASPPPPPRFHPPQAPTPTFTPPPITPAPAATSRRSSKAIASLVLSLLSWLICPIVLSIAAIVLGSQAKREIDGDPSITGRGMAQAGFVIGIAGLVIYPLVIVLAVIADSG
jgi:hypothetical protein